MPLSVPGLPGLPPELSGPVAVELAKPVSTIPAAHALPGGCLYEPKWDGYRLVVVRSGSTTRVWSKQGRDLTDRFPDVAAAAVAQVPAGTVLDGEVVVWNGSRLDFGLLQRRMVTAPGRIAPLVAAHPASYVAFDLLAAGGADLRSWKLTRRRAALEDLAARWAPPMQLSPATSDPAEARTWFEDYRPAGIEGLVAKGPAPATPRDGGSGSRSSRGRPPRSSPAGSSARSAPRASWSPAGTGTANSSSSGAPAPEPAAVGRTGRRPDSGTRRPPVAGAHRHRSLRGRPAVGRPHPRRTDRRRRGERRRGAAGRRVPAPLRFVRIRPDLRPDDIPTLS
ncbi:ATP-dependent DNA ligase [Blastococcus brunescens]|uniref:ATP-dependent DNA ligase n=1 Tax=Blastococcus brunescens TaxID=1564165 RepID=A0ABZ1B231_9ACTN|nr:ATP-dependent DNA ligase [Blastococcus sp. BMG 8361]WRL63933.1 ATP-dependent DNA ligase [Blastococcus sp. BMG 8361]